MRKLLIGSLLITEHADPRRDCACIQNEDVTILFFTVNSYTMAEDYAKVLTALGCDVIELCPGFGNEGVARVQQAIGAKIPVGVCRFDTYPEPGMVSPDTYQKH